MTSNKTAMDEAIKNIASLVNELKTLKNLTNQSAAVLQSIEDRVEALETPHWTTWLNVYTAPSGNPSGILGAYMHPSRQEADAAAAEEATRCRVACLKIEFTKGQFDPP